MRSVAPRPARDAGATPSRKVRAVDAAQRATMWPKKDKEVVEKEPVEPGYELSRENIAKLATYILCLWLFFSGIYAALIFITTGMRHAPYRHLPPKYLGFFKYVGNDATKTAPTTLPALLPWVKAAMNNCAAVVNTCVPDSTVSANNPIGFPVSSACGSNLCMNA